ncbi:MAG: YgaP family membrane protein [Candidatus Aminicenantales bacterium]
MKCNMSTADRILRIVLSVAVAVFFIMGLVTGIAAIVLGVLAVILFLTAVIGFCPVYAVFSTGTKKACPAEREGPGTN